MNNSYLQKIQRVLSSSGDKPVQRKENTKELYELGKIAAKRNLSLQQVFKVKEFYDKLTSAGDLEISCFVAGLYGQQFPIKEVELVKQEKQEVPVAEEKHQEKAVTQKNIELSDVKELSLAELQQENKLLKKMVELLEQKVNQPVLVQVQMPKLESSEDEVVRNEESGEIVKKKTKYFYGSK